ncbi:phosphoribosylanthranilate isomerase [Oceanidesulfovibrio marinus]|uniref:N-(5'-phosphoribosyl)anthranilate isomerase n=1 Tax=Oceanidesulfovibrio marinus TaxID=370038 RepID=A0A6P1ZNW3_9BACT|nr:phosphoribosylanthranilate isomerase [Oceanidesulfovibrio marinus]QJT09875.1 phosphoribosylanthranilate isomerase [Oceanidesulfovibrio marinus]TVM36008.1 phosphoribosylanthranilate isomerase [Oceanidesulfovibrio marinus]
MSTCGDVMLKVCGVTRQEDADAVRAIGASLIGFIFHPASRRNVTPEQVRAIETHRLMRVGVFVDQSPDEILRIMDKAGLHLAQLHGDQDAAFCKKVGRNRVMRAFWPERYPTREALETDLHRYEDCSRFFLFDAGASGGGHGRSFDASLLKGLCSLKTWFLAGGLGPHNICEAVCNCDPCGVDLSSGVEASPGIKDHAKLTALRSALDGLMRNPNQSCCGEL